MEGQGIETPELWRSRPVVDDEHAWLWAGFTSLNATRWVVPMVGALPLQLSEVAAWLDLNDVTDRWRRRLFAAMMQVMDGVYMEHQMREREAAEKAK